MPRIPGLIVNRVESGPKAVLALSFYTHGGYMLGSRKLGAPSKKLGAHARILTAGYVGSERRRIVRRAQGERRVVVRWEPSQNGRRQNEGRRITDNRFLYR